MTEEKFIHTNLKNELTHDFLVEILKNYHYEQKDMEMLKEVAGELRECLAGEEGFYCMTRRQCEQILNLCREENYAIGIFTLGSRVDELENRYSSTERLREAYAVETICWELLRKGYDMFQRWAEAHLKQRLESYHFFGSEEGLPFEKVYRIYQFDESLRDIFRKYIEVAEVYYRTQISYGFSMVKCVNPPYDQHYDENNFYNKTGYKEVMESFKKEKNYYKDSLIVKHHKLKYSSKMPLWVIVELMSFSNMSKLYSSMYYSEKDAIARMVGVGKDTLENHLHCLSVLRNKCAHAARMYNTDFNPPAKFTSSFLRKHPEIKNNSLFAYTLVLLKRLPDESSKKSLIQTVEAVIDEYRDDIDLNLIGFPENYLEIMENNL